MICKFLCVPFLINAQGNTYNYADSLFHAGNYPLAAVEYERIIFENNNTEIQAEAALRKSECLKLQGKFSDAAEVLEEINTFKTSDTLRYKILLQSGLNSYLAKDANSSFSKIELLIHYYPDSANNKDLLLVKILALNELESWQDAAQVYNKFMLLYQKDNLTVQNPYLELPKLKNPEKAEKLSAYLPFTAAGIFYAGNFKEGLLNAGLQVGFIAFGVYNVFIGKYITAALIGVGGYAAFYNGGVRRARRLTELYNDKKTRNFNEKVKKQLLQVIKNRKH